MTTLHKIFLRTTFWRQSSMKGIDFLYWPHSRTTVCPWSAFLEVKLLVRVSSEMRTAQKHIENPLGIEAPALCTLLYVFMILWVFVFIWLGFFSLFKIGLIHGFRVTLFLFTLTKSDNFRVFFFSYHLIPIVLAFLLLHH